MGGRVLDSSEYSAPVPWVGLYIAVASLACGLAMAFDAFSSLRRCKSWLPSSLFSLNATNLVLLSVAAKLPCDLSSPMPRRVDQLAKLSGTAFLAVAAANFLPSLGASPAPTANATALAILFLTVVADVSTQAATGVIYTFLFEHALLLAAMLMLILLHLSTALAIDAAKKDLEDQYNVKHADVFLGHKDLTVDKLKDCIDKYWLMAHTASPQYVIGRSATCAAAGALCLLSVLVLVKAGTRCLINNSVSFGDRSSYYKWSVPVILFAQAFAIGMGSIAPVCRWFNAVGFRSPHYQQWSYPVKLRVERYWVQKLREFKEAALPLRLGNRKVRKFAHLMKNSVLNVLIGLQCGVVVASKLVRLASTPPMACLNRGRMLLSLSSITKSLSSQSRPGLSSNLSDFVLRLEGEEELVQLIMRSGHNDTERWIQKGAKNRPIHLIKLIQSHSTITEGFKRVDEFDSETVPSLVSPEPPNCWALPLVTLTSIAVALSSIDKKLVKSLVIGVGEGIEYVELIEKHLDTRGLQNMRKAANILWQHVDIYGKWFEQDLHKLVPEQTNAKRIIERLREIAEEHIREFLPKVKDGDEKSEDPREWPPKLLAANCMYRISKTILQDYNRNFRNEGDLFTWLSEVISDVLGACLSNLPRAICMECCCCAIEVREERVRQAAYMLGQTLEILEMLENSEERGSHPEEGKDIDNWRNRTQNRPSSLPSTSPCNLAGFGFTCDELLVSIN